MTSLLTILKNCKYYLRRLPHINDVYNGLLHFTFLNMQWHFNVFMCTSILYAHIYFGTYDVFANYPIKKIGKTLKNSYIGLVASTLVLLSEVLQGR